MQPDEDVTMTDEQVPTTAITASTTEPDSAAQTRRTDHDIRPLYIPTTPIVPARPHASQNLISLYGLGAIAASVRRADPVTGEKINKIRKSYEGKVKQLHIAGINKPVAVSREFIYDGGILDIPQESWYAEKVAGNAVQKGMTPSLLAKLDRALAMAPGKISDGDKYKKLIGTDDAPKAKVAEVIKKSGAIMNGAASGQPAAVPSPNVRPLARPARQNAKRSYHDSTFTGYGEGFADEDGNIISEEESRSRGIPMAKKRRTDRKVGAIRSCCRYFPYPLPRTQVRVAKQQYVPLNSIKSEHHDTNAHHLIDPVEHSSLRVGARSISFSCIPFLSLSAPFQFICKTGQSGKLTNSCSIIQDHPTHSPLGQGTPYNYGLVAGGARTR
jgi:hypothetical protein